MISNALRTAKEDGLLAAFGGMLAGTVGIGATMAMLEHLPMRISNNPVIEGAAIGGQMLLATGSVILTTAALIKIGSTVANAISFIEATATDGSQAKMVEALTDFSKSIDEKASKETMQEALNKLQDQFEQKMPTRTTEVGLER